MDTLPLPPHPDLAQYRTRAKELVKAAERDAVRPWAEDWVETLARLRRETASPFVQHSYDRVVDGLEQHARESGGKLTLAEAQFLVARAHAFRTWRDFSDHVERLAHGAADPFESAADAVVTGDVSTLEAVLRTGPDLARARSTRGHRATLLHYVAANGVEDFRQLTPSNAVEIATTLLESGAEVDALADTYGGGTAQTTLNLLVSSSHPAQAGLQPALAETLLDHGAEINGLEDDGSPLMTALAFGYLEAAETLVRRGARIDNVVAAAGLGRTDLVRRMLEDGDTVKPSLVDLYWLRLASDPRSHVARARALALHYGHDEVVQLLTEHG